MKILAFSDLHGKPEALAELLRTVDQAKPDILLNCGDFSLFGEHYEQLFEEIEKRDVFHYFVAGNHEDEKLCRGLASGSRHSEYIGNALFRMEDLTLIGLDYDNSYEDDGDSNSEKLEDPREIESLLYLITKGKPIPEGPKILVSHFPPFISEVRRGSVLVAAVAKAFGVEYVIYGHLHEEKKDCAGQTQMINPGKKGKMISL